VAGTTVAPITAIRINALANRLTVFVFISSLRSFNLRNFNLRIFARHELDTLDFNCSLRMTYTFFRTFPIN
jgi:hypothetical protein